MGRDITSTHMVAGLTELFSKTAVPDFFWSVKGPQFTSKQFQSFSQQWRFYHQTSTPHYPQSNGKAKVAVKLMKRIIRASWNGRTINCAELFYNTGTLHPEKMPCHLHRNFMAIQSRMYCPPTTSLHSKAETATKFATSVESSRRYYSTSAHSLPDITLGTNVVV